MTNPKMQIPALGKIARAALLTAGLALTLLASAPRTAYAFVGHICDYYSDASHTTHVGRMGIDCCGRRINEGVTSAFSVCGPQNCVWCPPQQ
ncbi:MAG TPA: hypothetical protein VGS07_29510 [Thermoanaerobaculia bacterium]|jgi:hypothetical protein|nr:hypothetical protein [Thermoanaerobaculia bacterium]